MPDEINQVQPDGLGTHPFAQAQDSQQTAPTVAATTDIPSMPSKPENTDTTNVSPSQDSQPIAVVVSATDGLSQMPSASVVLPTTASVERPKKRKSLLVFTVLLLAFTLVSVALPAPGVVIKSFVTSHGSTGVMTSGNNDSALECNSDDFELLPTEQVYESRRGLPITYTGQVQSKITILCDGEQQTSTGGSTSFFNISAFTIDVAVAMLLSLITAKLFTYKKK